ncbi:MAG: right-handed parallel beta-helix repeat-containing protein [Bdellovibrionales bacterium]|nr:right-handed parallel beta-helix repeat-containing protein [Bdellovibrionales bacterium]
MNHRAVTFVYALFSILTLAPSTALFAEERAVVPGESLQSAIELASSGDVLVLQVGTYSGNIDFLGKAITVRGEGRRTIIRGDGTGSVVTFQNGEGADSILDSVRITGGLADEGGAIFISNSSPRILRNFIIRNQARDSGSAIYGEGATSAPYIANNFIFRSTRAPGGDDPHAIQIVGGTPTIVNNTIVRADSNGIHVSGGSAAVITNNIIFDNGTESGFRRGRGICDFNDVGETVMQYNLFSRNILGAILHGDAGNFKRMTAAEREIGSEIVSNNIDRNPRFRRVTRGQFKKKTPITNAGDPNLLNPDGSRSHIGHTGGPDAFGN